MVDKNKSNMKVQEKKTEKKMGLLPALLVAVLSFGGFVGVATIVSQNNSNLTPVSLAS